MRLEEVNSTSILIVVKLLKEHGIKHIVISPGGTNVAFVKAVQDDDFFKCYSVVDERSAMYFAIGLYLQMGEVIATSCTSAQATRNYIPGLTEAFYKHVPILAITMKKHPRFEYQEYMQAPNQTSLPEDCVKKSFEMPFITDKNDVYHGIRVANEAILELSRDNFGPIQLCIPWLDFPLDDVMPEIRSIKRYSERDNWNLTFDGKRILIVIGEHRPFTSSEVYAIEKFCECCDCAVYVNHLSNYHGKYSVNANLTLTTMNIDTFIKSFVPELIISIGGQTGDYPLYKILSRTKLTATEHWRVAEDGKVTDTYDKLTKVFQSSIESFFTKAYTGRTSSHDYFELWNSLIKTCKTDIEIPFSNVYLAQKLHSRIPEKSSINFAILNSLRVWSLFDLNPTITCYSNVGAFGIDGGMSTMLGQSVATNQRCFMIIGDLAFYYDMNSLAIRHIKNNVRILLVNNNGGVEFKLDGQDSHNSNRYIAAGDHFNNAEGWARTCGFTYISARNKMEFLQKMNDFLDESDKPILFEVFVSDQDEAKAYQIIKDANSNLGLKEKFKKSIKSSIKGIINDL
jgi:2-succinyl-5-enolpyruvyl-6-hydroxy-3-cyclohexene-1-carboxylate synthase